MKAVLPERIKLRREHLGITQIDLAEMTESSQKQIWLYESGKGMPSLDKLIVLAEALQTSSDWLLGLSDDIMPIHSSDDLSDTEIKMVNSYRSMSPDKQELVLQMFQVR